MIVEERKPISCLEEGEIYNLKASEHLEDFRYRVDTLDKKSKTLGEAILKEAESKYTHPEYIIDFIYRKLGAI